MQSVVCCQDSLKSLVLWRILDAFRPFRPSFGFFGFFGSRTWRQVSFGLLAHHMPARQLRLTELNSFLDNLCATDVRPCATVCDRLRWRNLHNLIVELQLLAELLARRMRVWDGLGSICCVMKINEMPSDRPICFTVTTCDDYDYMRSTKRLDVLTTIFSSLQVDDLVSPATQNQD